jgi:hypothetical protein
VALARSYLIGRPNSLGWQGRERGGDISPYDDIQVKFQNSATELMELAFPDGIVKKYCIQLLYFEEND